MPWKTAGKTITENDILKSFIPLNEYRISSIKPPGELIYFNHQKGGLLEGGGLIGAGGFFNFSSQIKKKNET